MRLEAIKFQNFRCFHDTDWLPVRDLTVLVGENDSGKTAVLDGVAILLGTATGSLEDVAFKAAAGVGEPDEAEREENFSITGRFSHGGADDLDVPLDPDGNVIISLRFSENLPQWLVTGLVPVDEDLQIDPSSTKMSDLKELLNGRGLPVPGGTSKEPYVQAVRRAIEGSPKCVASIEMDGPRHRALFEVLDFRTARDAQVVLNTTLRALFGELIRSNQYPELAIAEGKINKALQTKANELSGFVKRYRTDVQDVVVRPSVDFASGYRDVEIRLTDTKGAPIALQRRGQGLQTHLRLATFEWSGQLLSGSGVATRVVLFDEPDTHLDYHAQRRILGVIEEYAKNGHVLVATHSMNMINHVSLENIVHLEFNRAARRTTPRQIRTEAGDESAELNRIGESLGVENATMLYERAFVMFEGETEAHALPRMYEVWTKSKWYLDGVRFVNGYNNEGAIQFARFLHTNGRPVIALVDEDTKIQKASQYRRQFSRNRLEGQALLPADRIKVVGPSCFELAFSSACWSRAIYRATGGKRRIVKANLDALRDRPVEFIRYLSRRSGGLSKVELGVALASVIRRSEVPAGIADVFDAARELAQ